MGLEQPWAADSTIGRMLHGAGEGCPPLGEGRCIQINKRHIAAYLHSIAFTGQLDSASFAASSSPLGTSSTIS